MRWIQYSFDICLQMCGVAGIQVLSLMITTWQNSSLLVCVLQKKKKKKGIWIKIVTSRDSGGWYCFHLVCVCVFVKCGSVESCRSRNYCTDTFENSGMSLYVHVCGQILSPSKCQVQNTVSELHSCLLQIEGPMQRWVWSDQWEPNTHVLLCH